MKIISHLSFDGQGEEALHYYAAVFRGEIACLVRFGDAPGLLEKPAGPDYKNRLIFSALALGGGNVIDICDTGPGETAPANGNTVLDLVFSDEPEIRRVFEALSERGRVIVLPGPVPWTPCYAFVEDRFGVRWNLMQEQP